MVSYEKISLISEKTYNKVWLANLKNSDTIVVVKEISNANTDVLNSVASIKNIHIPNILSCETNGDITTIVEEYISGMPLIPISKINNYQNLKSSISFHRCATALKHCTHRIRLLFIKI